jgi:hypothetical protein
MTEEIKNFRLKLRNTERLNRPNLTFTVKEAKLLDANIKDLEKRIERLELEALQRESLSIDIIGSEF